MKISFCYPPFTQNGKYPNLPQNRQFSYTKSDKVKLYPVVLATGATWLANLGHNILWLDGITNRLSWPDYQKQLTSFSPDMVVLETKTPIMPLLWNYINELKTANCQLLVALLGDHVTFLPQESLEKSKVDYIVQGGDYDFLLVNLVKNLTDNQPLEKGVWSRENGQGQVDKNHNLNDTPTINRDLTNWADYGEAYLYQPIAYSMFGRGCLIKPIDNTLMERPNQSRREDFPVLHSEKAGVPESGDIDHCFGNCFFCSWQQTLWQGKAMFRSPEHVIKEVEHLVKLRVKEVFDDTESGVVGDINWLEEFYFRLKDKNLLGKVIFSSNARGDQLDSRTCQLLKKIGYRLLKIGLESGSDSTLTKINKKETVNTIINGVKNAKDAGLNTMLTIMVGYPWETEKEVVQTYQIARELLLYKTKAGDCLQASILTPYPGTVLHQQALKNNWFAKDPANYENYDMGQPILHSPINTQKWCQKMWSLHHHPKFITRSLLTIKNIDQLKTLLNGAESLVKHLKDWR